MLCPFGIFLYNINLILKVCEIFWLFHNIQIQLFMVNTEQYSVMIHYLVHRQYLKINKMKNIFCLVILILNIKFSWSTNTLRFLLEERFILSERIFGISIKQAGWVKQAGGRILEQYWETMPFYLRNRSNSKRKQQFRPKWLQLQLILTKNIHI